MSSKILKLLNYHKSISLDEKFSSFEYLEEIPKIIHVSWKSKDILKSKNPIITNGILNMKSINTDYDLQISDDKDVDSYIMSHIPLKDYENIKNKHIVEKVDLWRLLKMYHEGGIYVDIDRYCNIPFKHIIVKPTTRCVLPTCRDLNFSQDIMISCKGNPIHYNAIFMNLKRRQNNPNCNIYYLGPTTYMNAVTFTLYGLMYKEDLPPDLFNFLRQQLNKSKYFQSFREDGGGCDGFHRTILYDHTLTENKMVFNGLETKKLFYYQHNVKPWGD
jgi:hypothetical protein